jgi:hypothetical protein
MNALSGKVFNSIVINKNLDLLTYSMVLEKKRLTKILDGLYLQVF